MKALQISDCGLQIEKEEQATLYQGEKGELMVKWLCTIVFVAVFIGLVCAPASAGILTGRIIKEDGKSLSKSKVVIDGKETQTNDFGGYQVELGDGERELKVMIDNVAYTSEKVLIYSPRTEQNWRIDSKAKKLIKIR